MTTPNLPTQSRPAMDSRSTAASRFRTSSISTLRETVSGKRNTVIPALLSGGNRNTSAKSKSNVIKQRLSAAQISNSRTSSTPFSFSWEMVCASCPHSLADSDEENRSFRAEDDQSIRRATLAKVLCGR